MPKKFLLIVFISFVFILGMNSPVYAELINYGGGLIYDSEQDITWLQDINAIGEIDGWENAMDWVQNFSYYGSERNLYWNNWRLPSALNSDGSGLGMGSNF